MLSISRHLPSKIFDSFNRIITFGKTERSKNPASCFRIRTNFNRHNPTHVHFVDTEFRRRDRSTSTIIFGLIELRLWVLWEKVSVFKLSNRSELMETLFVTWIFKLTLNQIFEGKNSMLCLYRVKKSILFNFTLNTQKIEIKHLRKKSQNVKSSVLQKVFSLFFPYNYL